jgi:dihydrodipicolinate synthase/N-acetylneuraminate lyase
VTHRPALQGVLVATVTPFTPDGAAVDVATLHAQIERLVAAGVHGLVPGGSTGEFTTLTVAERTLVTAECVKAAGGQVPVIAATGALSTAETVDLAEVDGVRYLKDTSGDAVALGELLLAHSDQIIAFNGWDTLTFFGLVSGATGTVWGATNVIPELSMQLWDAVAVRGDLAEGRALWAKIWPICAFLESYHYAAAVKTGLELIGHSAGPVRAPFTLLDAEARAEFTELLAAAGAL